MDGNTIESDNGQRAMYLMHVGSAKFELCRISASLVLAERLFGPLQGQINFTLDPGQRAQIKFRCRVHDLSRCPSVDLEAGDRALQF